jgi:hypothetical protein
VDTEKVYSECFSAFTKWTIDKGGLKDPRFFIDKIQEKLSYGTNVIKYNLSEDISLIFEDLPRACT